MDMYISIAIKMLIGSIAIFTLMRIIGKKAMSELTPFDLLYVLILGALIEESIYDEAVNVLHVIFAIVLWGITVYSVEKTLEKTEFLSSLIHGEPSVLIDKGHLNMKELKTNHFDMEQLRAMLRQNDCYSINDAYYAILEVNGGLSVIKKDEQNILTLLLIEEDKIKPKTLQGLNKDKKWLHKKLADKGYPKLEDIIYCEWHIEKEELIVETHENTIDETIYIDD